MDIYHTSPKSRENGEYNFILYETADHRMERSSYYADEDRMRSIIPIGRDMLNVLVTNLSNYFLLSKLAAGKDRDDKSDTKESRDVRKDFAAQLLDWLLGNLAAGNDREDKSEIKELLGSVMNRLVLTPDTIIEAALQNRARDLLNLSSICRTKYPANFDDLVHEELTPAVIHKEMREISRECLPFSYYFTPRLEELVAHIENGSQNVVPLQSRLKLFLARHGLSKRTSVRIVKESVGGRFCSSRSVGCQLHVEKCRTPFQTLPGTLSAADSVRRRQTVGVYLQYNTVIYWVSTAHAAVQVLASDNPDVSPTHWDPRKIGIFLEDGTPMPSPHLCFRYARDYSQTDQSDLLREVDDFELPHSVDVMVGQLPLTTDDLCSEPMRERCRELRVFGTRTSNDDQPFDCQVTGLLMHGNGDDRYDAEGNLSIESIKVVYTTLDTAGRMIRGYVLNSERKCLLKLKGLPSTHWARNVLIIAPGGLAKPKKGDSGSVWVIPDSESDTERSYKAVAITVGYLKNYKGTRHRVWIAALLSSSLSTLCAEYPGIFQVGQRFEALPPEHNQIDAA